MRKKDRLEKKREKRISADFIKHLKRSEIPDYLYHYRMKESFYHFGRLVNHCANRLGVNYVQYGPAWVGINCVKYDYERDGY